MVKIEKIQKSEIEIFFLENKKLCRVIKRIMKIINLIVLCKNELKWGESEIAAL